MHTDSETTDISLLGFMPYMIVVSLEMSDEPDFSSSRPRWFYYRFIGLAVFAPNGYDFLSY